jgi:LuxR family transcriptional regulator, maltose regulon positive regulatory protein
MTNELPRPRRQASVPRLSGKLLVPTLPGRVLQRRRLFSLLDLGVERAVTLVAAPAGSGKTILLTSWLAATPDSSPVAWMSLDSGDNDPVRFWTHVLAAFTHVGAVPADSDLHAMAADAQACLTMAPRFVEQVDSLDEPIVLVLDDLHELTDRGVLAGIEFLVRHPPSSLRLVLSTRADPPLPLHRLLLTQSLSEIRAADLAFTVAEVAELLEEYEYRPLLSDSDMAMLYTRTEGWAAGVRLAAVSMQGHPNPHRFVVELAGDDRSLSGYLVSEVLDRQTPEQRSFMIRTSVVTELSGGLADALTDGSDGELTLARLASANAFLVPADQRRDWYRYHPLFAELLRYELRREIPDQVGQLHRRAARWYVSQGLTVAAVEQLVLAKAWHSVAELIAQTGLRLAMRGAWPDFRELVDRVPDDVIRTEPELALLAAAERLGSGRDDAVGCLRVAREQERRLTQERHAPYRLLMAICGIRWARRVGDLDEVVAAAHDALAVVRLTEGGSRAVAWSGGAAAFALSALGIAELWLGRLDAAEEHLEAAQAAARWADLDEVRVECLSHLAVLEAMTGRLTAALGREETIALIADEGEPGASHSASTAAVLLALAMTHLQRNDLGAARRHLGQATPIATACDNRPVAVLAKIVESRLRYAGGDMLAAFSQLRAARQIARRDPPPLLSRWLAMTEVELHLAVDDVRSAHLRLGQENAGDQRRTTSEQLAQARVLLGESDPGGAFDILSTVLNDVDSSRDPATSAQGWLLLSRASHVLGRTDEAAIALGRAIDLSEPEDNRRVVLDAGTFSPSLLVHYRSRIDSSWPFLDELVQVALTPVTAAASPLAPVIEPLSKRERDVLGYLPSMLTFEEIGSELYISVNTTKSHVRSIYRKLGVVGRRDAVSRARQLYLLRS